MTDPSDRLDPESASTRITLPKGKRRQFNAKVRSGCITCKKRRVKCDEAKPHCNRCLKFGATCDGYLADKPLPPIPYILPKRRVQHMENTMPPMLIVPSQNIYPSTSSTTKDIDWTLQPFQALYDEAASHIRGIFPTSFWEKLVLPEMCGEGTFIRHGIIAVGILSRLSQRAENADPSIQEAPPSPNSSGYSYALNHYDHVLQGIRTAIANGQNDIRNALIACLLVFCFESLQGNQDSAIMQARSGLALLDDWIRRKRAVTCGHENDDGIMDQDLMDAFRELDSRVQMVSRERSEDLLQWHEYGSSCSDLSYQ